MENSFDSKMLPQFPLPDYINSLIKLTETPETMNIDQFVQMVSHSINLLALMHPKLPSQVFKSFNTYAFIITQNINTMFEEKGSSFATTSLQTFMQNEIAMKIHTFNGFNNQK